MLFIYVCLNCSSNELQHSVSTNSDETLSYFSLYTWIYEGNIPITLPKGNEEEILDDSKLTMAILNEFVTE